MSKQLTSVTKRSLLIILIALLAIFPTTLAMPANLLEQGNEPVLFKDTTALVTIYTTVQDRNGQFINGLTSADFDLIDNGKRQKIEYFSEEAEPLTLGILLDTSESMQTRLEPACQAIWQLLAHRSDSDEFFLLTFNTSLQLTQDFTYSRQAIKDAFRRIEAKGLTSLNDAVFAGIERLRYRHNKKQVLLLVSDGQDNCSRYTEKEVIARLKETDLQLYAIAISQANPNQQINHLLEYQGNQVLKHYATLSGGQAFFLDQLAEIGEPIKSIDSKLQNQYNISFTPAKLDGKWHDVKIKLKKQGLNHLIIQARPGYLAKVKVTWQQSL